MRKRIFIVSGIFIFCLVTLAVIGYGESEKAFTVTVGAGMASSSSPRHEEGTLRRIDTPIRLKIIDIKNIMGVMTMSDILFIAALFIGSILVIYLVLYFVRRNMNRPKPLSAYELAIKNFAEIDIKKAKNGSELKDLYYKISRIVRDYSKDVLSFGPKELTTKEFLAKLEGETVIAGDIKGAIKELIVYCDLVKFAGNDANIEELGSHFDGAKKIIEQINVALAPKESNK